MLLRPLAVVIIQEEGENCSVMTRVTFSLLGPFAVAFTGPVGSVLVVVAIVASSLLLRMVIGLRFGSPGAVLSVVLGGHCGPARKGRLLHMSLLVVGDGGLGLALWAVVLLLLLLLPDVGQSDLIVLLFFLVLILVVIDADL